MIRHAYEWHLSNLLQDNWPALEAGRLWKVGRAPIGGMVCDLTGAQVSVLHHDIIDLVSALPAAWDDRMKLDGTGYPNISDDCS